MALEAIILDLDGTLVDTNGLHAKAWTLAIERYGYRLDQERIAKEIGKSGSILVPDLLGERAEREKGDQLRDAHDEIYLELLDREELSVFPGAPEIFERAEKAGLRTAVASGSKRKSLEQVAEQTGFDFLNLADEVVTDDDVNVGKPCPDSVIAAYEKLNLSPAQCVMVGDTPYDVEAAHRAGVLCLGVLTGVHSAEKMIRTGARAVYRDIGELGENLDDALLLSTPGPVKLTWEAMRGLMDEALAEARRGLDEEDLPVGAVLADGSGSIVGRGRSRTETTGEFLAHGEMQAFAQISGRFPLHRRELILVTTLEPCMMCFGAAMGARVDTIIYALKAPSNGGIARCRPMQSPGMIMPRVVGGVCAEKSLALFEDWNRRNPDRPFVKDLLERSAAPPTAPTAVRRAEPGGHA